jgi:putative membrane protein
MFTVLFSEGSRILMLAAADPAESSEGDWGLSTTLVHLLPTLVYVLLGLLLFGLVFKVLCKAIPFSVRKEIEQDQNVALAILMGAVLLGMAMIIAAAVHG